MSPKETAAAVRMKLTILHKIAPTDAAYYRGIVVIAHDYVIVGARRELLDLLRRVPPEYFLGPDFISDCGDEGFRASAEEIALAIMNFRTGGQSDEQN